MKSRKIWLGLPLIVLVLSILFTGCDDLLGGLGGGETTTVVEPTTPVSNVSAGSYASNQTITLTTTPAEAEIYYTLDGNDPTASSLQYTNPIAITGPTTLKAIAINGTTTTKKSKIFSAYYNVIPGATLVTSGTDGDTPVAGSLRKAYNDFAENTGGTIIIDKSVPVILLVKELNINKNNITIEGNGVIIQRDTSSFPANQNSLIMVNNNRSVTIRRVHFKDGKDASNASSTIYGRGGAIYNKGNLLLESCIFTLNTTYWGGAIYNAVPSGSVTATNVGCKVLGCTFYNNSATSKGGAIYHESGTLNLKGNLFYGNTVGTGGTYPIAFNQTGLVSDGYNVVDIDFTGAQGAGWSAQTGDKTLDELYIETAPFDTTSFVPISDLKNHIPSSVTGLPIVDFNGALRTTGVPGAVNAK